MQDLIYKQEVFQIVGAAMNVHRYFGPGFTEKVYQEALQVEFQKQEIPYKRENPIRAKYHDIELNAEFVPDLICYNDIVVELKAVKELDDIHRSQAINYGKVAGTKLSLLINFGEPSLRYERYVI
jgi:GxxExxY protein